MTTFRNPVISPMEIGNTTKIHDLFLSQGFCVVTAENDFSLEIIRQNLMLNKPYQSSYNKKYFPNKSSESRAIAIGTSGANSDKYTHKAFEGTTELGLHVDGTFSSIAAVKTTILLCKNQAESGGETVLFNALGAARYMESSHPKLANALKDPLALKRESNYDGVIEEKTDCAIGTDPVYGEMAIRMAFDKSANWECGFDLVENLREAHAMLLSMTKNPLYRLEFTLPERTMIIMDNTKICHGRKSFIQNPDRPRVMIRTVHDNLPFR